LAVTCPTSGFGRAKASGCLCPAADVARLKQEDGPALVTQGSSDLLQTLFANDLVDQINVFTFPVVLGHGKKLFGDGKVATGDFAMDPPTPAEIARRERLRQDG